VSDHEPRVDVPAVIVGPVALERRSPHTQPPIYSPLGYSLIATYFWLAGSLAIVTLAALMSVGPERRVYLPGLGVPVPETCTMKVRLGLDCPGCGLTRAFIHFAHGRLLDGLMLNPAGIVIFLFVAAQPPAAATRLALGRSSRFAILWTKWNEIALILLPVLTFVQWVVRLSIGAYT
jgi:hypothetical protein